ncbi:alpha/beta fold hydrolase [Thalassolituus sp. ST750PaO-4]|uniref:alpha/beta fold hydrolase n=1 Tax=Thalassolituus sp. ST750PaO-4 TaxID=2742965 RepID=UPI001CE2EC43|nr:alpha/beta fold hydrolase [Thalassolituus sp. ST750PaO-4]MCA6058749.1 alpha/beta fold hydrolase [Thalassolituus sp. ST750PaO-4]
MNPITLLRMQNSVLGHLLPATVARRHARMFLTPRQLPLKEWELATEKQAQRLNFAGHLSALRWANSGPRILLMHGWESRATHMAVIANALVAQGFDVFALDAPRHGQSGGNKSNPMEFARAIIEADIAFGPFYGALGHSMGGAALAIASAQGVQTERCVLVSSPASLLDVLKGFARFMRLPAASTAHFIRCIEAEVGCPAGELHSGHLLSQSSPVTLLIHAQNDIEIPSASVHAIRQHLSSAEVFLPPALGHRKIIRDPMIAARIQQFFSDELIQESETEHGEEIVP